jgi:hypothetical protein
MHFLQLSEDSSHKNRIARIFVPDFEPKSPIPYTKKPDSSMVKGIGSGSFAGPFVPLNIKCYDVRLRVLKAAREDRPKGSGFMRKTSTQVTST